MSSVKFGLTLAAILTMALSPVQAIAQTSNNGTMAGLMPGSPAGSYSLSDFEDINLYNGSLNVSLPILSIGGRGSAGYAMKVNIQQRWSLNLVTGVGPAGNDFYYEPVGSWPTDERPFGGGGVSSPGSLFIHQTADNVCPPFTNVAFAHTDVRFTSSDGTQYVLRDKIYDGQTRQMSCPGPGVNRGNVFVTRDGSGMTFVSDYPIEDSAYNGSGGASGHLFMRDGTCYRFDGGGVSWIRDRNGNMVRFPVIIPGTTIPDPRFITDSLNRQVTIENVSDVAPYGVCTRVRFKGASGAERIIRISSAKLSDALRTTQPGDPTALWTYKQLFDGLNANGTPIDNTVYNPLVPSALWLPDGRSYQFKYNVYGELARITLPSGGAMEYDFDGGVPGTSPYNGIVPGPAIYRRLIARRVYPEGGSGAGYAQLTTYDKGSEWVGPPSLSVGHFAVSVNHYAPGDSQPLAREKHYFYGNPAKFLRFFPEDAHYPPWGEGREYKTESLDRNGSALRRVEHTWRQRGGTIEVGTDPSNDTAKPNDPRILQTVMTMADANLVSKQTFDYDQYNNKTNVYEYNLGVGAPGPLIRRKHTDYVTTNNGVDYAANTNIHIRNLPLQQQVFDAGGKKRAETIYEYDNYNPDASHAALGDRQNITGHDGAFSTGYLTRGNPTRTSRSLLDNEGAVTGSISGYAQYDIAGNVVKAIDGRTPAGITTIEFDDRFDSSPDDEAQSNDVAPELAGGITYAFPTKVTNALGHTAYTQYDYYLGRAVNTQDANGVISSIAYNDVLDRPTQSIQARYKVTTPPCEPPSVCAPAEKRQTTITYDDANRVITTSSDLAAFDDNKLASKAYFDGLGRQRRGAAREGATWIITDMQFDALSRVSQVSNPYRAADPVSASPPPDLWTRTDYDALGRVIRVIAPDGAHSDTAYSGNQVTVTDQALKSRRNETDALGRLTKSTEAPGELDYVTFYSYDALNNLRQVNQGSQTRTLVYDSLSRLVSATDPESGTVTYAYDPNGNPIEKTDARGVKTTITYDALNRAKSKVYSGITSEGTVVANATPPVFYFCDDYSTLPTGAPQWPGTPSKGRLIGVTYGGGSEGTYYKYDNLGRIATSNQRQGTANYATIYEYNLAGNVTNESRGNSKGDALGSRRRYLQMMYDEAGRLSAMDTIAYPFTAGNNLVRDISFTTFGALQSETYGNGLIHSMSYNERNQPTEMRLGRSDNLESVFRLNYIYGTANNVNGQDLEITSAHNNNNIARIKYLISGTVQHAQTFQYDQLNRLSYAVEHNNGTYNDGARAWYQTFAYDPHGNRGLDPAHTSGNVYDANTALQLADFSAANNRITHMGYLYDASGNLIAERGNSYTYDAEGRMVTATVAGGVTSQYFYDGIGLRVKNIIGGVATRFEYGPDGVLIAERNESNGSLKNDYFYRGGQLLASTKTGTTYEYATADHLGSPRAWTDDFGNLLAGGRHDYMPFGGELFASYGTRTTGQGYASTTQQDGQRKQFTGHERDKETGLDFAQARYFFNGHGRFTSPDSFGGDIANPQTLNLYAYVLNNPLRYTDPSGHWYDEAGKDPTEDDRRRSGFRKDQCWGNCQGTYQQSGGGQGQTPKPDSLTPGGKDAKGNNQFNCPSCTVRLEGESTFDIMQTALNDFIDSISNRLLMKAGKFFQDSNYSGGGFGFAGFAGGKGVHGEALALGQWDYEEGGSYGFLFGGGAGPVTGGVEYMRNWRTGEGHWSPILLGGPEFHGGAARAFGRPIQIKSFDFGGLVQYDHSTGSISIGAYGSATGPYALTGGGGGYFSMTPATFEQPRIVYPWNPSTYRP
jgi:RHS repeat-associated protein